MLVMVQLHTLYNRTEIFVKMYYVKDHMGLLQCAKHSGEFSSTCMFIESTSENALLGDNLGDGMTTTPVGRRVEPISGAKKGGIWD